MRWPLMKNNINAKDAHDLAGFLLTGKYPPAGHITYGQDSTSIPSRLTNGDQVRTFEREFADWLGVKYSVMVNSGSSANIITMQCVRDLCGDGEVIVPAITWESDIAAVIHAGLRPVFVDIDPLTFGLNMYHVLDAITRNTQAVFATHCLGFDTGQLYVDSPKLIEDCCESIGATRDGKKLGTLGIASNFSFYYGHHMTTIEGGMICTDDADFYQQARLYRSHGMVREFDDADLRAEAEGYFPDLHPDFIFAVPGFNMRPTEINAVLGRSQLKRLDENVKRRTENLRAWLQGLGPKFRTDYSVEGSSSFALPLVLKEQDKELMGRVLALLREQGVEYRRGTAGGGNQLRQPYIRARYGDLWKNYPQAEHVHFFGLYVGNYPDLAVSQIEELCERLNTL